MAHGSFFIITNKISRRKKENLENRKEEKPDEAKAATASHCDGLARGSPNKGLVQSPKPPMLCLPQSPVSRPGGLFLQVLLRQQLQTPYRRVLGAQAGVLANLCGQLRGRAVWWKG